MATKYFIGAAVAAAQVSTGSIDSVDATPANNTFTVTINGVAISVVGDTDVATTATNLRAALNAPTADTSPFSKITWSGTGGNIIGTSDIAGLPFTAALTETGAGTGTVTDFTETTANAYAGDWNDGDNWSDGSKPASADTAVLRDSAQNITTGFAQSAVTLAKLVIEASYTGLIGLQYNEMAISADGETTTAALPEYRDTFLSIGWDDIEIGGHTGTGSPSGSGRLKLNNTKAGASTTDIQSSATSAQETGKPPIRLKFANASADITVRGGSVGIGVDVPAETSTIGDLSISPQASSASVVLGSGVTVSGDVACGNGSCVLRAAADISGTVSATGGTLTLEGDYVVAALNVDGATVIDNHIKTSGNAVTTGQLRSGTLDWQRNDESRTYATFTHTGGTLLDNPVVTTTTYNRGRARVSI